MFNFIQVSDNAAEVIPGSEYIIIAAPANAHPDLLKVRKMKPQLNVSYQTLYSVTNQGRPLMSYGQKVAPHIDYGARVGALFAQGGFDWAVKHAFGPER